MVDMGRDNMTSNEVASGNLTGLEETPVEASIISNDTYKLTYFICYGVILPVIATVGLVGNVLAACVLVRTAKRLRQSIYIYMSALTISDTLYMVIILFRAGPHVLKNFNPTLADKVDAYSLPFVTVADLTITSTSVLLIIMMSVERYMAVRTPLAVNDTLIARFPLPLILTIVLGVVIIVIPLPFCMRTRPVEGESNVTEYITDIRPDMVPFFDVYVLVETLLLVYLPFLLVLPLNLAIAVRFHYVNKRRRQDFLNTDNVPSQQLRVMATVFAIMIMYTLFTLPQITVQTLSVIDTRFSFRGAQQNLFLLLQDVANILVTVNAATDFVVYILMSRTYRARFSDMFCRRCARPDVEDDCNVYMNVTNAS